MFFRAIRHLRQHFQATGHMEDRPRSGRPCITLPGQDRYFWTPTHLHNHFQTATATAPNTHGIHNNCISAQIVPNCLRECGLSPYVGCVLARCHRVNHVNWARAHKCLL